ncbi:MAG: replication-relaxation family protein [Anaerolineae bacterium]|nr:replication-relaxation family protein [Anaerolineae bacterium]
MSDTPKARRPRHKRVEEQERPVMVLTDRDKDIIRAVNDHRALKQEHIQALFFNSRSTAQFRLQRLYQNEFLDRQFLSVVSGGPAASPAIYTLEKRGVKVLVEELGLDRREVRLPKGAFSWQFIEHLLKINDFRVAVALAARINGFTLEDWRDETVFRANPDYVTLHDKRDKPVKKPVLPDGYFCLAAPRGKARFFLEIDRGTEELSKFTPQIKVYNQYTASGQYAERFAAKSLRVLIISSSPRRQATLMEATKAVGGDRKYWFTTFGQISAETVFTAPIWQQLESDSSAPLIQ